MRKLPFPTPAHKKLPIGPALEYWNALDPLHHTHAVMYVQRWFPVMKARIRFDEMGRKHVEHESCAKFYREHEPLTEEMLVAKLGYGDYSFRLNDSRITLKGNPNAATVLYSELKTKRDWNEHPPVLDYKQLDLEDPQNAGFITWARSKGLLPGEAAQQQENADMATSTVLQSVIDSSKEERERADRLQKQLLEDAKREAREAKDAVVKAVEPRPAAPASDLLNVVTSVATLAKSLAPAKDDSLSEYLKLEAEREKTRREEERADREAARNAAQLERERADKLQSQIIEDLKQAKTAVTAPKSDIEILQEMIQKRDLMKQAFGNGTGGEEEETRRRNPSIWEKIVDAVPSVAPLLQNVLTAGLQAWQTISYNNALARTGQAPAAPQAPAAVANGQPPANGQPAQPENGQPKPPTMTAEQQAAQQQFQFYMQMLNMAAPHLLRFLKKDAEDRGFQFAQFIIENAPHERADYDAIRELGMIQAEDGQKMFSLERAKQNMLTLIPHHPLLAQAIGPIQQQFDLFLEQFFTYPEVMSQEEKV